MSYNLMAGAVYQIVDFQFPWIIQTTINQNEQNSPLSLSYVQNDPSNLSKINTLPVHIRFDKYDDKRIVYIMLN